MIPDWGTCRKQPTNVSLILMVLSLSVPLPLFLSLKSINIYKQTKNDKHLRLLCCWLDLNLAFSRIWEWCSFGCFRHLLRSVLSYFLLSHHPLTDGKRDILQTREMMVRSNITSMLIKGFNMGIVFESVIHYFYMWCFNVIHG